MILGPPLQQRLACLGDASRYRMVVALASGERCVSELAAAVGLSQSCTTRHLQALETAGLVHRIRYGKRVMVGLCRDEPELRPLLDWVLSQARGGRTPDRNGRNGSRSRERPKEGRGPRAALATRAPRMGTTPPVGPEVSGSRVMVPSPADPAPPVPEHLPTPESDSDLEGTQGRRRRPDTIEDYLL